MIYVEVELRPIPGFDNYLVSEDGRIYSKHIKRFMKTHIINSGYEAITITQDGQPTNKLVHRLVGKAFVDGYVAGLEINHKDGNRLNNHHTNLEWCTRKENVHDSMKRGTHTQVKAHRVAWERNKKKIQCLDKDTLEVIKEFPSINAAKEWTGGKPNLNRAFNEGGTSYSYRWKLVE